MRFRLRSACARWHRAMILSGSIALAALAPSMLRAQEDSSLPPEPTYFESSSQFRQASSAALAEPDLNSLLRRLEETEHRLRSLEAHQVSVSDDDDSLDLSYASYQSGKKDEKGGEKKKEPPKEKKWYDNYSIRGYAQFRYNYVTHTQVSSTAPTYAGDSSIGPDQEFLIRRARLIFTGNISDHLRVYLQPDFASTPDGAAGNIYFAQIRDWYGDIFLDKEQVHRFRVGQSKVPYGWENLQSSQNRLFLDRNDAFNSAVRNERDLGVFYYWTPEWATDLFKLLVDENLKGSGNYGLFGVGVYNGQGGSLRELNDQLHVVSRLTWPWVTDEGNVYEAGIQGYIGEYVVRGSTVDVPGGAAALVQPAGTLNAPVGANNRGHLDKRLGWTFVKYPQPFGFQAEWTIGEGPALNAAQTAVTTRALAGGYVAANYKWDTHCYGTLFPFARYQYFQGGYKSANNSPYSYINEWDLGLEWQIRKEVELVTEYVITDRTNVNTNSQLGFVNYGQFMGDVLRFQLQVNY